MYSIFSSFWPFAQLEFDLHPERVPFGERVLHHIVVGARTARFTVFVQVREEPEVVARYVEPQRGDSRLAQPLRREGVGQFGVLDTPLRAVDHVEAAPEPLYTG